MANEKRGAHRSNDNFSPRPSSTIEEMMLASIQRGSDSLETGRYIVTFKEGASGEGIKSIQGSGLRFANAQDFQDQAATLENVGDADGIVFPEIGVALIGGDTLQQLELSVDLEISRDSPMESIDPEYFVFSDSMCDSFQGSTERTDANQVGEYLRGFLRATETIVKDLGQSRSGHIDAEDEVLAVGATWGLNACRVPASASSGAGIKVAVLDTGMDLGHPDFAGRTILSHTFVGQPVQDQHGHGTHCIGTACGPQSPAGSTPRYGIGHRTIIYVGKVLSNSGSGAGGSVLAGMNWAIANRCQVISMSLGSQAGVQPYYTAAGQAALNNGLLIVAAAGNAASNTGAPANSPTIMSVASLDQNLSPSSFSNYGKIEISAPGRDVFSSIPMPRRDGTMSGTSMATPHVAGCAALWAQTSSTLRGTALWRKIQSTARRLPFSATRVGAGLVQSP